MKKYKIKMVVSLVITGLFLIGIFMPMTQGDRLEYIKGFDKGPSYTSVVPLEKTTFVKFDEDSYLDDYAYLAAVPTAVFEENNKLYSHPLLYYQEKLEDITTEEKTLDAYVGTKYFMEDWMSYCNGQLDQRTLINLDETEINSEWDSKKTVKIIDDDQYNIAKKIALQEWSCSNDAVISVVDNEFSKPQNKEIGVVQGKVEPKEIITKNFEVPQVNKLNPQYMTFTVPDDYKYIQARTWFASLEKMISPFMWIVLPAGDKDMQLYCKYNDDWMQVAACSTNTNQWGMDPEAERANSYVYSSGEWRVGITDIPTESADDRPYPVKQGLLFTRYGTWREILSNMIKGVMYNVEVNMYPGTVKEIPVKPPFECSNVDLKLTWDNPNVNLGFSLIGPSGEEIVTSINESRDDNQEIHLDEIGQLMDDEYYKICVFTLDDIQNEIDFEVEYSWEQRISKEEGDSLASATEGAIIASALNAPLLYTSSSKLSKATKDVIYKLGVENIYVCDIGGHLSNNVRTEIDQIATIKKHYKNLENMYKGISDITNQKDIVWTSIDPWSYWFFDDEPEGEKEKAMPIGPAAYCAAHHGSPAFIVDMHAELSSAVVWHNEFWKNNADERTEYHPSVSEMYLTGKRVYNFLDRLGFDNEDMETMITVADHFDIGMSWDRVFVGKATPGRILGTPVDTSTWINRNVFYPALIFENPALDDSGVELINGSKSHRRNILPWGKFGLVIDRPSQEENFKFPILHTYTGYMHRFNEMAEKYYGFKYTTADEKIPGETITFNAIDDGLMLDYTGEPGSIFPDLTTSEIGPIYAKRGGYSNAFSTSFDAVMNNLNKGSIIWIRSGHGTNGHGGGTTFWNPDDEKKGFNGLLSLVGAKKEKNPWRGYEWYLGSTQDPDTMTMEVHGVIPALIGNPNIDGLIRTGVDWGPAKKPILDKIGKFLSIIPIVKNIDALEWLIDTDDYRDGMVQSVMLSTQGYPKYHGNEVDEALDNIYSCGVLMGDCQPAGTLYHLSLVRHGSSFQIIDPWPTSWYGSAWAQSTLRDLALGHTIGEVYVKGISKVGILYITEPPQWWWDLMENVCFYGDPDLRIYVPDTTYSSNNYWTKEETQALKYNEDMDINGHMPFGATEYPNEKEPQSYLMIAIIIVIAIILLLVIFVVLYKGKK